MLSLHKCKFLFRSLKLPRTRCSNLKGSSIKKIILFHIKRLNIFGLRPLLEIFLKIFFHLHQNICQNIRTPPLPSYKVHSHPSVSSAILDSPQAEQRRAYNSNLHWGRVHTYSVSSPVVINKWRQGWLSKPVTIFSDPVDILSWST